MAHLEVGAARDRDQLEEPATPTTEKKEERPREDARRAEGAWAELIRTRKNAKGG